jgi:hypothetical protein
MRKARVGSAGEVVDVNAPGLIPPEQPRQIVPRINARCS